MRVWLVLLGGMIVWAVHFFALYAFASIWLTSTTTRLLTGLATAGCIAADAALLRLCLRIIAANDRDCAIFWPARVGLVGAGLSLVAVLWQGLPALIG